MNLIKVGFLSLLLVFGCHLQASEEQSVWLGLATVNLSKIEQKTRIFILRQAPNYKDIELKWVQTTADISKTQGQELLVVFLPQNGLMPIEQSQHASAFGNIKYVMRFIHVRFSAQGEAVDLRYEDALLTADKASSEAAFWQTFKAL